MLLNFLFLRLWTYLSTDRFSTPEVHYDFLIEHLIHIAVYPGFNSVQLLYSLSTEFQMLHFRQILPFEDQEILSFFVDFLWLAKPEVDGVALQAIV